MIWHLVGYGPPTRKQATISILKFESCVIPKQIEERLRDGIFFVRTNGAVIGTGVLGGSRVADERGAGVSAAVAVLDVI